MVISKPTIISTLQGCTSKETQNVIYTKYVLKFICTNIRKIFNKQPWRCNFKEIMSGVEQLTRFTLLHTITFPIFCKAMLVNSLKLKQQYDYTELKRFRSIAVSIQSIIRIFPKVIINKQTNKHVMSQSINWSTSWIGMILMTFTRTETNQNQQILFW